MAQWVKAIKFESLTLITTKIKQGMVLLAVISVLGYGSWGRQLWKDRQIPGAHWLDNLGKRVKFKLNYRPCPKRIRQAAIEQDIKHPPYLYMHMYRQAYNTQAPHTDKK